MIDNKEITIEKVTPGYIAQKCPVCNGFGTVKHGAIVCNACEGRCYVVVPIDSSQPAYPNYRNRMIDGRRGIKK